MVYEPAVVVVTAEHDGTGAGQLTEWPQFSHFDPHRHAVHAASPKAIDGHGTLDADTRHEAGWRVGALGCP
ncbi:hypothetical protein AQI88_29740 [Streptomyces cellostaticus]|uniref:Uncharacterized protein n=1 Tax=Streptomyces cellostaticus TaxID=67285 RepID=A0A101NGN3_9ACTN|nr:hypothetical protein [Streptomyces cellostaticus]KUM92876.1 hypothetical protein AQI88_29740 [Streptomyces cellostaticus]